MNQLDSELLLCDFNMAMVMSVVASGSTVTVAGNFRSQGDLGGLIYNSIDSWSNSLAAYASILDFTGVELTYDFRIDTGLPALDSLNGQTMAVHTTDAQIHYVRPWNYIAGRPQDSYEEKWPYNGSYYNTTPRFPTNRSYGSDNGYQGYISLDFDNLYSGWAPYEWDAGTRTWINSPTWKKIDPTTITKLSWSFVPLLYTEGSLIPLTASTEFGMTITNWTVTGARPMGGLRQQASQSFRLADGYDDNYNVTPKRYIDHFYALGFRDWIDLYIGASHYYDKAAKTENGTFVQDGNGNYIYEQSRTFSFNRATRNWLADFFTQAAAKGYKVIASVAMESVDAAYEWRQLASDGTVAASGWVPPTHFLSFTNTEVQAYYKAYMTAIADLQAASGLPVIIQLGEPWWWNQNGKPCFYDASTTALYAAQTGNTLPVYKDTWWPFDSNVATWLSNQIGEFTWLLRDAVKAKYPSAQFGVLFYPPSVLDNLAVGPMMTAANFPQSYWQSPNLDFFELEDYDWVINGSPCHKLTYALAQNLLGYSPEQTHYFAGFVLNPAPFDASVLWQTILQAAVDGITAGFTSFLWAGAQIRRDNWHPPYASLSQSVPWLQGEVTTTAWCWRITFADGTTLGFTSHDQDLVISSVTYEAATGFSPTAVDTAKDMSVDNMEVEGFLDSNNIKASDILAGRYDYAQVVVFLCNWSNISDPVLIVRAGTVGKITSGAYGYQAEIRGLMEAYQQINSDVYQKHCRAKLGDSKCQYNLAAAAQTGKVIAVNADGSLTTDIIAPTSYFDYGTITFTSSANAGASCEIMHYQDGIFILFLPPAFQPAVGDTITALPGCDGNLSTCINVFDNVLNFRGEPYIPGNDYQASYPTQVNTQTIASPNYINTGVLINLPTSTCTITSINIPANTITTSIQAISGYYNGGYMIFGNDSKQTKYLITYYANGAFMLQDNQAILSASIGETVSVTPRS